MDRLWEAIRRSPPIQELKMLPRGVLRGIFDFIMVDVYYLENIPRLDHANAVAVGVFDGVHLGHRRLISTLSTEAGRLGGEAVALTFERHPAELLAPDTAPLYINTLNQRVRYLQAAGAGRVVVVKFDKVFAALTPQEFFVEVLIGRLGVAALVVGPNFRFGKGGAGDVEVLRELAAEKGVVVMVVPPVIVEGDFVSSTRIRALVAEGDVSAALELLGRNFTLAGTVVHGERIGHKIGFPTANIHVGEKQLVPARGVYAAAFTERGRRHNLAVVSIGVRPTVGGAHQTIEVHVPGFRGNIYGEDVEVEFVSRLRPEQKFHSLEELSRQIQKDIEGARLLCLSPKSASEPGKQA